MITANTWLKMSWQAYRLITIVPAMAKQGLGDFGCDITSLPLQAYVNHGRWIVKCECGGAEKAWEEGWFMCQSCYNAKHKHQYRKVIFPEFRKDIEELLSKRPLPNRNWIVNETIGDLMKENEEHNEELL